MFMIFDEKQNKLYKQALLSKVESNVEIWILFYFFEIMRWGVHFILNFQIKKVITCLMTKVPKSIHFLSFEMYLKKKVMKGK